MATTSQTGELKNSRDISDDGEELAINEFKRGNNEYMQKNYRSALIHFNKSIALANFNTKNKLNYDFQVNLVLSLLVNRAITQLHMKEYQQSIEDCTTAIKLEPSYLKPYICRAFGYYHTGSYELAIEDFETCFKIQPFPYNNYNTTLLHNLQKAKEELSQLGEQKRREAAAKYILSKGQSHFASLLHLLNIDYDIHPTNNEEQNLNNTNNSRNFLEINNIERNYSSDISNNDIINSATNNNDINKNSNNNNINFNSSTLKSTGTKGKNKSLNNLNNTISSKPGNIFHSPNPSTNLNNSNTNESPLPLLIPVGEVLTKERRFELNLVN